MKKDNKAIIQIGIHKINDMFYNSGREPIHNLQIEGTFTEIELPDVDGYRCKHRNSWCGTMAMSSRLSNVPPPHLLQQQKNKIILILPKKQMIGLDEIPAVLIGQMIKEV